MRNSFCKSKSKSKSEANRKNGSRSDWLPKLRNLEALCNKSDRKEEEEDLE